MTIVTKTTFISSALEQKFTLKSTEPGGQLINDSYFNSTGFSGKNRSPQLYWEHAPKETQSFAVTMYDMDAPTGSGLWHWVVLNFPADVNTLEPDAGNALKHLKK